MEHKREWHTCDRCGAEIDIPEEKKWCNIMEPLRRMVKLAKPITLIEGVTVIGQKEIEMPHPKLEPIEAITLAEYYQGESKKIDLCPKCRKDFERFMKNDC